MSCKACRTLPAVVSDDYKPKGHYEKIDGLNTYVTGPTDATIGIVNIYDIFGFATQTIQGADLMATRLNALILIPDLFEGLAVQNDWIPADTTEKKEKLTAFMSEKADIPKNVTTLQEATESYMTHFRTVKRWGAFGLCWGGKIVVLSSGTGSPFVASGQAHPGRVDKADAEKLTIPHIVLASKDESSDAIAGYAKAIKSNTTGGLVETYNTMWHGWMGARANLEKEDSRSEYSRGYTQLADFFEKYLR